MSRALSIRKTADLPFQLWVGTCARFVAIGERSDVPRFQQVEQKAVERQRNLGLNEISKYKNVCHSV